MIYYIIIKRKKLYAFSFLFKIFVILPERGCTVRFSSFSEMLAHFARITPDASALIYDDGEKRYCSFAELYSRVQTAAEQYRRGGKRCLGVLADGRLDCIITIFAANTAGLQLVILDENTPTAILKGSLPYADIDCLWGDEELCEELRPFLAAGPTDTYTDRILFFTSGTTSRSKAVALSGRSLMNSAWNGSQKLPLTSDDRLLCMLPLAHVFGFVCGLLWGLSCGATVALGRGARHYFDDCAFYNPTAVSAVPSLLGFLLQYNCLNPDLRLVLGGAGECAPAWLQQISDMGMRVSFGYGLTETSSGVAISVSGDPYAMEVCPDNEITIAEDEEILIKAPTCLMQGYYKMPEATAAAVQDGILYSGDLGFLDEDGKLHISGRKKDMLVLQDGTKIFLPEYEEELAGALGTKELAVVLRAGKPVLVICTDFLTKEDVFKAIRPVLDSYPRGQQISDVVFRESSLPRTATGKIQRYKITV